jgi:hypothetical protein
LPSQLRALGKRYPREIFGALFAAASETLLELGQTRLGGLLGVTMMLHTWTRDLRFHPHVHALVTAGVLARDGACWLPSRSTYLFPVEVMGQLLRGKMLDALRRLETQGAFLRFPDFADPEAFDQLMRALSRKKWIVYAKKPFRRVEHVLAYLGRYTHRIGIANSRLVEVHDDAIVFRTKNGKTTSLEPVEFLRRFVQHVLPNGFHKIRHYGLYAGGAGATRQQAIDGLAATPPAVAPSAAARPSWIEQLRQLTGRDVERCPCCGGVIEHRPLVAIRPARAPPRAEVSG